VEALLLLALLATPVAFLLIAVRVRRAREAAVRPWDKSFRNAMLLGVTGALLVPSGLYAFSMLETRRFALAFMLPVVLGVVLLTSAYRTWMRGVAQVPEE
jgi:hypothetical protein